MRSQKTFFQWKNNSYYIFQMCVCSIIYPACKTHAPYYNAICNLSGCTLSLHIASYAAQLKKKITWIQNVCFYFLCTFLLKNFSLWENFSDKLYINVHTHSLKIPVIFSDCNQIWIFFRQIFEKSPNIKWMKIRPVGAELFHADGRPRRT